ncbi:ThrRS/AlaRS common domain-containing protein [Ophiobolus disseminans]|uniref:ThrRS/AlaRS common domain-containing protein n=1 Tax=Ophiobolus disseminans TaxID=1469910 RepID=A0A6A6ZR07_9PLEO|nr:ThrRS/AlaRS common domain-containing protein [Ophiobolus disseminans]
MAVAAPTPVIVGALKCQKDSYLQTFETEVVSCSEYTPPEAPKQTGRSKTKKSTDPSKFPTNGDSPTSKTWLVELSDSVLFPEGGGQPTDHGTVTPLNDHNAESIPITSIQRHGLQCIHFSPIPLEPGTKVRQTVDFQRRWDHMQQHTGQHLLSAIMDGMDLPTVGWSMGAAGEMNYVELPRKPTDEEIKAIQQKCNELIRDNMSITVETPEGKGSDSLPENYDREKGVVRFIKIGDLDYNACCGTHLKQTSHIGIILLHHTASVRGTNCRLYFTAGDRAIKMASESINGLRSIAVSLSSSAAPADVVASVQRLGDQVSEARKKEKKMLAEIAGFEGGRIKALLQEKERVFSYRPTDGLDFITLVVFEIKEAVKDKVVVLCSGEAKATGSIVVIGKPELVESMAAKVKEIVSTAKGGGKGEKWQGKVTEWQKGEIEALKQAVEEA